MSQDGKILSEKKFSTNVKVLEAWVKTHPKDYVYAIEAGTPTKRLYWALKEMGREIHMAHPVEVRRMMGTKKKTDREDSAFLADLLRMGRLPKAYVPEPEKDEERQLLRYRMDLGKKIKVVKNQVHALLNSAGISTSDFSDVFGEGGSEYLRSVRLHGHQQYILNGHLKHLELLTAQIDDIERALARIAQKDPRARTLMQIKGISFYSALVILNEVGDVTRFPTAKHLTSYAGLVPRIYQSGNVSRTGHIHKQGPKALRWIMVQCANSSIKGSGKFLKIYTRLVKRIGHQKAITAVARRMLAIVFVLLTRGCEYEERDDRNVHYKMRKMERKAKALPDVDVSLTFAGLPENARKLLRGERDITDAG
jgi:transposase